MITKHLSSLWFASALLLTAASADILVKDGETVAFMGDSITQAGNRGNGYVNLVIKGFAANGLKINKLPAGKSGNKSNDMLARLDAAVISKKPDWMTLSCGVNDVWHFKLVLGNRTFEGVGIDDYKKNITEILDKCQKAGIKVVILTSTMIGEDASKELNQDMIPYNDFLRQTAKERELPLADLNTDMQAAINKIPGVKGKPKNFGKFFYGGEFKNRLTTDGCHMNPEGNRMMARGVLRAFGFEDAEMIKAEKNW